MATLGPVLSALAAGSADGPSRVSPSTRRGRGGPRKDKLALVPFRHSPFPYDGQVPDQNVPFLDVSDGLRRGHNSPRGGIYWEDPTYRDRRSLLFVPGKFDPRRLGYVIIFFHGNNATLERDVRDRQQVPQQVVTSGLNAVLVAPQFALDANDSSAGHFWQSGGLARYLDEAHTKLAELYGQGSTGATFARLPVILIAYSGGYHPAAWSLAVGGVGGRVRGVILLDAMYGDVEKFAAWVGEHRQTASFISAYSESGRAGNAELMEQMRAAGVPFEATMPKSLRPGRVAIIDAGPDVTHEEFVTRSWVEQPLAWLLARVR